MDNSPLCRFGPGGDYVKFWGPSVGATSPNEKHKGIARLVKDLGLEAMLDPTAAKGIGQDHREWRSKSVVAALLEVFREIRAGTDDEDADEKLVTSQIRAADAGLARLQKDGGQVLAQASAPLGNLAAVNCLPGGKVTCRLVREQNAQEN